MLCGRASLDIDKPGNREVGVLLERPFFGARSMVLHRRTEDSKKRGVAGVERKAKDLLERCRRGDPQAQEEFFHTYKMFIFRCLNGLLWDQQLSLELTQDVFVSAFRSIGKFRGECKVETWLYKILLNRVRDHGRRARKGRLVLGDTTGMDARTAEGNPGGADNPEVLADRTELRSRLTKAIKLLPQKQREAIILREVEGLSYKEIAELMDCRIGTVMSTLSEARRKLRVSLSAEGDSARGK